MEISTAVDLAIDKGGRVAVIGINGAGKTTPPRTFVREQILDTRILVSDRGLKIGYFAREHETLDDNNSVFVYMQYSAAKFANTDARKVLASFLFSGNDVDKPARVFSGGEKTRLALATRWFQEQTCFW